VGIPGLLVGRIVACHGGSVSYPFRFRGQPYDGGAGLRP
jgi:hypothetical protein